MSNQNVVLKAILECGTDYLRILDEIGYDLGDIVDDLLAEGIKPTLNAITSEVFCKGVIEWFCNCLDTRVWFRQNGSIYRRYLSSALDSFEDNVGFSLTGGEGDDN